MLLAQYNWCNFKLTYETETIQLTIGGGGIFGGKGGGGGIETAGGAIKLVAAATAPIAFNEVANIVLGVFCTPVPPNNPVFVDKNAL